MIMKTKVQLSVFILMAILITILITSPVHAQTITMANPGLAERDILVYYGNGTLHGFYNSTSVITLDGGLDYIFTLKPMTTGFVDDPSNWLTNVAFPYVRTNIVALVLILFCIGVLMARR
jgi:hypothetical protein